MSLTQFSVTDPLAPAGYPDDLGLVRTRTAPTAATSRTTAASVSYVTGSHNIKAGFTLMHSWRYTTQEPNNSVSLALRGRQPFSLTQYATPIQFHETLNYNAGHLRAGSVADQAG